MTHPSHQTEAMAKPLTKRKVTLKLIEDVALRKACFKKRQAGLLKKMGELRTLCDIDACAIIFGPSDTKPTVWPCPVVTRHLLQRFQEVPHVDRLRNVVNQRDYMLEKTQRLEDQLARLKQRNDEKEISILMHQIYHDGKSLSDFEPSQLKRLLCYVEEKKKNIRKRISHLEKVFPHNPHPPLMPNFPLQNGIHSGINIDEQVSDHQSFLDLVKELDQMNSGFDNNTGSSMGLPPYANLSGVDKVFSQGNCGGFNSKSDSGVFPSGNFGGLIGGNDSRSGVFDLPNNFGGLISKIDSRSRVFPPSSFGGRIGEKDSRLGELPPTNFGGPIGESKTRSGVLSLGNFEGLNCESGHLGSGVLPQGKFGGLNGESNPLGLLPQGGFIGLNVENDSRLLPRGNFRGLNGESGDHPWVLPKGNFGGLNVESDSMILPQGNFTGLIGESNSRLLYGSPTSEIGGSGIWQSFEHFGSTIGGSDIALPCSSSKGNINETYMGMEQHNENQGGSTDNTGLWCHQKNFGANTSGVDMGRFDAKFVDSDVHGRNLNLGLPSHGNFASTSSGGCEIEVPISFARNFPGSHD